MLNKAHDVVGVQIRELDWAGPEAMAEKVANERHVVDDRGRGQGARLAQIRLICVCTAINRASLVDDDLFGGNHSLAPQKVHQVHESCMVATAGPAASSAI